MSEKEPIQNLFNQLRPRPATRIGYHPRNYSLNSSGNFKEFTIRASRKSQLPGQVYENRVTLNEPGQYLHIRLMRKRIIRAPDVAAQFQKRVKLEENLGDHHNLIRKRKMRGMSTARTEHLVPSQNQIRPATSQIEKVSYFDELCSHNEALKAYKIMSHIGKGAFSVVQLAVGKEDHKNYAIKTYEKIQALDWNRLASIKREIRHLRKLEHSRVVKLIEVVKQRKKIYLILENGGKHSLCGLLRKDKIISEVRCIRFFKQILEGISYCHQNGVCHRDIKPENILIDDEGFVKIIDFGFSANSRIMLSNYCGTPAYMSPEIVKKQPYIGAKADIWALGVMLFLMSVGTLPFRAPNEQQLNRLITVGKYRYREQSSIPMGARRLIARMLQVSPSQRPSAKELLEDTWFD